MFKSITFEIIGDQKLTCEGCEQRVERLLKALPGVDQVRAKAGNQHIKVLFDSVLLEPEAIKEHLDGAGYKTKISD
jgi:copper chaperone